jgi:hypothetical protein
LHERDRTGLSFFSGIIVEYLHPKGRERDHLL